LNQVFSISLAESVPTSIYGYFGP